MSRRKFPALLSRRLLCSSPSPPSPPRKPPNRIWNRTTVDTAAAERRKRESLTASAKFVSSWMMPWERAQMDVPTKPLNFWERVYWRLFVVLGGVGFAYETWVLGNRNLWKPERPVANVEGEGSGLYAGNHAFISQRLLSDEELDTAAACQEIGR